MTLELINPDDLTAPTSYTQVVAAKGSQLVFVSGQAADDAQGNLVGLGDLAVQAARRSPTSDGPLPLPEPDPNT
jgi:enamine deaminase RidA (YjgF/YER057c/UK114 family)